jgi:hypothetical protein
MIDPGPVGQPRLPNGSRGTLEDLELGSARRKHSARNQKRHNTSVQSDLNPGESIWVSSGALQKEYAMPVHLQMNAEQIPPACFTGNNLYFDIVLNGGTYVGYADKIILQMILTNPSVTDTIYLGPAHQLFDKLELLVNGSTVQDTLYPEQWYFGYMQDLCDEARANMSANYGFQRQTDRDSSSNPYELDNYDAWNSSEGIPILPGDTYTYYIELPVALTNANIFLPAIGKQMGPRYRFYPSSANCKMKHDVSPVKPTLQQAIFVVGGPQFHPDIQSSLIDEYNHSRTVVPCIGFDRQIINLQPTSGKETGDLTLNSITGQVAALMCILRPVAVSNDQLFSPAPNATYGITNQQWKEFDLLTVKEGSGRVIGYEKEPMQLYRTTYWAQQFRSNLALEKCVLFYPFCQDIMKDWREGANTGSYQFESSETIKFTPYSVTLNTFTDGDPMEFLIFVYRHAVLSFNNGQWMLRKL